MQLGQRLEFMGEVPYEMTLRLTLLLLILYGSTSILLDVPVRLICGAMLVVPALLVIPYLWWVLTIFLAAGNLLLWFQIDNHKYLITYWVVVCALSLSLPSDSKRATYLRTNARWLVALVFFFATLWKVLAGEYFNGLFIQYTFLTDPRLESAASLIAGVDITEIRLGREAIAFTGAVPLPEARIPLATSSRLEVFALFLSWATVLVEGTIAVTHSAGNPRLYLVRHAVLILFVAGTYFLLPVIGFAVVLAILGFAETSEADNGLRAAYLALFGIVHLTLIPWQQFLAAFL